MSKILNIIGDVHGEIALLNEVTNALQDPCLLVGDIGLGFPRLRELPVVPDRYMIHGNHDDPSLFKEREDFVGRFGTFNQSNIFCISGAYSIDAQLRTEWVDWWRDEQLSYSEMTLAQAVYRAKAPEVVVSHEAPQQAAQYVIEQIWGQDWTDYPDDKTSPFLQMLFEEHAPKVWVFGHYHARADFTIENTRFICLDEIKAGCSPEENMAKAVFQLEY